MNNPHYPPCWADHVLESFYAPHLLGEGWRLPTNDEWREMAKQYGGVRDDSKDNGKAVYKALLTGGSSEFNASNDFTLKLGCATGTFVCYTVVQERRISWPLFSYPKKLLFTFSRYSHPKMIQC